jgi:hypothetical protein
VTPHESPKPFADLRILIIRPIMQKKSSSNSLKKVNVRCYIDINKSASAKLFLILFNACELEPSLSHQGIFNFQISAGFVMDRLRNQMRRALFLFFPLVFLLLTNGSEECALE